MDCTASSDVATLVTHCSPDLEYLIVKCRHYYLPREFTSAIVIAVYVPPQADVKNALGKIYTTTNAPEMKFPETLFTVAGDFNQANLKRALPKYRQHISGPTRGPNILDHGYTTIKDAYRSIPLSTLCQIRSQHRVPPPSLQAEAEMGGSFIESDAPEKAYWYGNCSAQHCKKLQKVVCTAQTITEANLPSMDSIYTSHCCGRAANIIKDPSHCEKVQNLTYSWEMRQGRIVMEKDRLDLKVKVLNWKKANFDGISQELPNAVGADIH
eukprot:g40716.t1